MMVITLCGSMKVIDKITEIGSLLQKQGFKVYLPALNEKSDYSQFTSAEKAEHKSRMIKRHLEHIKDSDAILVVNETLKDIEGYVGANSFLEMGFAFVLDKKIFILYTVPDQSNTEEILGLDPVELKGDLEKIKL